jgi:hypothetical protein
MARIHSLLFWLGKFIPEEELLEGQRIPLREIIFNFISKAEPSEEEVEEAMSLAEALQRKAKALEMEIRDKQISKGEAHLLLDEICGLLRAVDEIRHAKVGEANVKAMALMKRVADEKRWLNFVRTAT